jgi:hypothetical protein
MYTVLLIFTIKLQFAMVRHLKFFDIKHCSNLDHTIASKKQSEPSNHGQRKSQIKDTFNDTDANYRMQKSWDANGSGNHKKIMGCKRQRKSQIKDTFNDTDANYRMQKSWDANNMES